MRRRWMVPGLILALAGCGQERQAGPPKVGLPAQSAANKADPFASVLLPARPEKVLSVREALTAKEGEVVAVSGRTPPEKVKPFNSGVAAFIIMDPTDLDKPDVKEEFDCDDAAT